jgi:urease accessory protein
LKAATRAATAAALAAASLPARAHLLDTGLGDFAGGALHLVLGLPHLLPVLALGLVAGLQGPLVSRWVLMAPAGLALGVPAGVWLPGVEPLGWIALGAVVLLGLLAALAVRLDAAMLGALALLVGIALGYADGGDVAGRVDLLPYVSGAALGALVLLALVTTVAITIARLGHWGPIALRSLGSWLAAIGLMAAAVG